MDQQLRIRTERLQASPDDIVLRWASCGPSSHQLAQAPVQARGPRPGAGEDGGIRRGDVVDPFCSSGSLLVGTAERGATVIGSDRSARALGLATSRLRTAVGGRCSSLEGRRSAATAAYRNSARGMARSARKTNR